MKLLTLLNCDIYRDGGSLEGIWLTDEHQRWAVTLHIVPWENPNDIRHYRLFNCPVNEVRGNVPIAKNSPAHQAIKQLIDDWITEQNIVPDDARKGTAGNSRLSMLLGALDRGNF